MEQFFLLQHAVNYAIWGFLTHLKKEEKKKTYSEQLSGPECIHTDYNMPGGWAGLNYLFREKMHLRVAVWFLQHQSLRHSLPGSLSQMMFNIQDAIYLRETEWMNEVLI